MTLDELKSLRNELLTGVRELADHDAQAQALAVIAATLVFEVLLDIKSIAGSLQKIANPITSTTYAAPFNPVPYNAR